MPVRSVVRGAALALLLSCATTLALPARAALVQYQWIPGSGSGGSGFLTLDSALITDPLNFGNVAFPALTQLQYTFGNGVSIQKNDIQFFQGFPFSASAGQLTNNFQFSTNTVSLSFNLASNAGISSNQVVTPGPATTDFGNWRLAPAAVPLPPALPLLAMGIGGLLAWRRKASATA